jgi:TIR domain-containing protein
MADIFISYTSSDRPRAERLKCWFEEAGWTTWIDREIELGEGWEERIQSELESARVVIVLWGAEARRSEWVQREAAFAQQRGRLLQVHATGLPLLPPFDAIQAVRMQSWSGEPGHSERAKLLQALAGRLGGSLPQHLVAAGPDEHLTAYHVEISEALELAFYYCARQVERVRLERHQSASDFEEIRRSFDAMLALLRTEPEKEDDREGVLHRLMEDFLSQLMLLAPNPRALS